MKRKPHEIKNAIAKLENNLKTCVPYSCFGNDNRKQIYGMLETIKHNHSRFWINSTYLSTTEMLHQQPDNCLWQSALDARDWLDGKFEIEELLFTETRVLPHKLFTNIFFNH